MKKPYPLSESCPAEAGRTRRRLGAASVAAVLVAGVAWLPGCSIDPSAPTPEQSAEQSADEAPADETRTEVRTPLDPRAGRQAGTTTRTRPVPTAGEIRGGRVHSVKVATSKDGAPDLAALLQAAKTELPSQLGAFSMADFEVATQATTKTLNGDVLHHTTLSQRIAGVPVQGAYLRLTTRASSGGGSAKLASSSYRLYPQPRVDVQPSLAHDAAVAAARQRLRAPKDAPLVRDGLLIRAIDGQLELAWEIAAEGGHYRAFVVASGKNEGKVLVEDARYYQVAGTVTGDVAVGGSPSSGNATVVSQGMPNLGVSATGGATASTDAGGNFTIDAVDGETLSAELLGLAADVNNIAGSDLAVSAPAAAGVNLNFAPADDEQLAETTAYAFVDRIRKYLEDNAVPGDVLGSPLTTNANLTQTCNAFFSPFERSINFFQAGGGCHNTAIDTVIVHEYGHFADDAAGGIFDGGLSEGWGDLLACYSLDATIVGEDFFEDGGFIRSCENDYVFPIDGFDEVHNLGQAWAGFAWRVRQGLMDQLGPEEGDAIARALVIPSLMSNAPDIPEAVREVFLRDDDDGDLDNGTPHFDVLAPAAEHHGLLNAVFPDETAPAAITDLQVSAAAATTVTVQWTATGDDDLEGEATSYDLRISSAPIDETNFASATPVSAPAPAAPGTVQSAEIAVLPGTTLFIAMRVVDDAANASGLSNVVEATTDEGVVVFSENVEDGGSAWTATGLWHATQRRASDGSQSFWYGQESTGNYDTGEPNSGTLTSPVISLAGVDGPILSLFEFLAVEGGTSFDLVAITITNVDDPSQSVTELNPNGSTSGFQNHTVSLVDFEGASIQISFAFDTVDDIANDLEGWFVDDIRVLANSGPGCGDLVCDPAVGEDCLSCSVDCGTCEDCGDAVCDPAVGEDCSTCPTDCGPCAECGDAECGAGEDCSTCPADCGPCAECGDAVCDPAAGEDCSTCPVDCGECSECGHDLCETGAPLVPSCDECVQTVCDADSFCCEVQWDSLCVSAAEALCGLDCTPCGNGVCDPDEDCATCSSDCGECPPCEHDICEAGGPLFNGCDYCTPNVCKVDPFCCTTAWDSICIGEAEEHCAVTCDLESSKPADGR